MISRVPAERGRETAVEDPELVARGRTAEPDRIMCHNVLRVERLVTHGRVNNEPTGSVSEVGVGDPGLRVDVVYRTSTHQKRKPRTSFRSRGYRYPSRTMASNAGGSPPCHAAEGHSSPHRASELLSSTATAGEPTRARRNVYRDRPT